METPKSNPSRFPEPTTRTSAPPSVGIETVEEELSFRQIVIEEIESASFEVRMRLTVESDAPCKVTDDA